MQPHMQPHKPELTALIPLLQLVSPSLPIGSFTYSQGLEWTVETGWISSAGELEDWLGQLLHTGITHLELPILKRLYQAIQQQDQAQLVYWVDYLNASRETQELLQEEKNRGRALTNLLIALDVPLANTWKPALSKNQSAAFALASVHWQIPFEHAAYGYAWSWLENLVLAAVKLIPLGQTQGQITLAKLAQTIPAIVANAAQVTDEAIGASSPALAIASSLHETQYTRLFRS